MAHASSPTSRPSTATRSRKTSLPITPAVRMPSATSWAPVSVEVSIR